MVGEETTSFPEFCPTRGGHGVGGVRGGWYMNLGAQSLQKLGAKSQNLSVILGVATFSEIEILHHIDKRNIAKTRLIWKIQV